MGIPVYRGNSEMPPQKRPSKAPYFIAGIAAVATAALVLLGLNHFAPIGEAAPDFSTPVPSTVPAFVSDEFGFSVRFPAKPTRQDRDLNQGGQKITIITFISAGSGNRGFGASTFTSVCTPKGDDVGTRLKVSADGSVTGAASASGSTSEVQKQTPITIQGHPGLQTEFTLAKDGSTLHMVDAVVIDGPRFYSLTATNPATGAWDNFLKSFKITKDPAPLPECAPFATT